MNRVWMKVYYFEWILNINYLFKWILNYHLKFPGPHICESTKHCPWAFCIHFHVQCKTLAETLPEFSLNSAPAVVRKTPPRTMNSPSLRTRAAAWSSARRSSAVMKGGMCIWCLDIESYQKETGILFWKSRSNASKLYRVAVVSIVANSIQV